MLQDATQLGQADLETDTCIIGGGAAGITLAKELNRSGRRVLLVESGGLLYKQGPQELYRGKVDVRGFDIPPQFLYSSRLRYFGGTTNHWLGWCRPLDPFDFETKDWIPFSGWPFDFQGFISYYDRACTYCDLDSFFTDDHDSAVQGNQLFQQDATDIRPEFFYFSPPTRFGLKYRDELEASENVTVLLNANCMSVVPDTESRVIKRVELKTLGKKNLTVRAKDYVLACGALENARILLASDTVMQSGVGNEHDAVGRYYQDHPHLRLHTPYIMYGPPGDVYSFGRLPGSHTFASNPTQGILVTTPSFQRRTQSANASIDINTAGHAVLMANPDPAVRRLGQDLKTMDTEFYNRANSESDAFWPATRRATDLVAASGHLHLRTEQVPNPESRVSLTSDRDQLGMRRLRLDWKLTDLDRHTIHAAIVGLSRALPRNFSGRLKVPPREEIDAFPIESGFHHSGTTRMSTNPRQGVVDGDCRVHGLANLYVAGSSVFPTTGYANPTLTIVALAVRLADHLKSEGASN